MHVTQQLSFWPTMPVVERPDDCLADLEPGQARVGWVAVASTTSRSMSLLSPSSPPHSRTEQHDFDWAAALQDLVQRRVEALEVRLAISPVPGVVHGSIIGYCPVPGSYLFSGSRQESRGSDCTCGASEPIPLGCDRRGSPMTRMHPGGSGTPGTAASNNWSVRTRAARGSDAHRARPGSLEAPHGTAPAAA